MTENLSYAGHLLKCHESAKVNSIMQLDTPTNNFVYDCIKKGAGRQRNPVRDVEKEQIERKENKKVETSRKQVKECFGKQIRKVRDERDSLHKTSCS